MFQSARGNGHTTLQAAALTQQMKHRVSNNTYQNVNPPPPQFFKNFKWTDYQLPL